MKLPLLHLGGYCGKLNQTVAVTFAVLLPASLCTAQGIEAGGDVTPLPPADTGYFQPEDVLRVGATEAGWLRVLNSSGVDAGYGLEIGSNSGASGLVTISGYSQLYSNWINMGGVVGAGAGSSSMLTVTDGSFVQSQNVAMGTVGGSVSRILVSGMNSRMEVRELNAGVAENGFAAPSHSTLTIADGAELRVNDNSNLGVNRGASASVLVTGEWSLWQTGDLNLGGSADHGSQGDNGTGELVVERGARVESYSAFIGSGANAEGHVTVRGEDSRWDANRIHLGQKHGGDAGVAKGTLVIEDGGVVRSSETRLGDGFEAEGSLHVSGGGSQLQTNHLAVGSYGGIGRVVIEGGGTITDANSWWGVDVSVIGNGRDKEGSSITVTGNHSLLHANWFDLEHYAEASVRDGGTIWTNYLSINSGSTLEVDGGTLRLRDFDWHSVRDNGLNYISGTIQLAGWRYVNEEAIVRDLFGEIPQLTAGKGLKIEEAAILTDTVVLDGGTFGFGEIFGREHLEFRSGTIFLFGHREIGSDDDINHFFRTNSDLVIAQGKGLAIEERAYLGERLFLDGGTLSAKGFENLSNLDFISGTLINSGLMNGQINMQGQGKIVITGKDAIWNTWSLVDIGSSRYGLELLIEGGGTVNVSQFGGLPSVTVTVTGSGSLLNASSINANKPGQYSILNGGMVDVGNVLGGASKSVLLDGGTLKMQNSFDGGTGFGWLDFRRGTLIETGMSNGHLEIPDEGHVVITDGGRWNADLYSSNKDGQIVGDAGRKSSLTVSERGRVYSHMTSIGRGVDGEGTMTIQSRGELYGGKLTIGEDGGHGVLLVESEGEVRSSDAYIGRGENSVGVATVRGEGSVWNAQNSLTIGFEGGQGTLLVEDGGRIDGSSEIMIGADKGSLGTVTVRGENSQLSTNSLYVGANPSYGYYSTGGTGSLTIEDGGVVRTSDTTVGRNSSDDASGMLIVRGAGSRLDMQRLSVGIDGGDGELLIENGGRVGSDIDGPSIVIGGADDSERGRRSSGSATVTGSGSELIGRYLDIGVAGGRGELTVEDGGYVMVGYRAVVGAGSPGEGDGKLVVRGAGSHFEATDILVGLDGGNGELRVEGGGRVTSQSYIHGFVIGSGKDWSTDRSAKGSVTVTGRGSELVASNVVVGDYSGDGTLTVEDGGTVLVENGLRIGANDANASVTVRGAGSSLTTGYIHSQEGTGELVVADGAVVRVTSTYDDAFLLSGNNFLRIAGGIFAWQGDQVSTLIDLIMIGNVQYWDGTSFASVVAGGDYADYFRLEYIDDAGIARALDSPDGNLSGFEGYTILSLVPEPRTYAVALALVIGVVAVARRRRVGAR